MSKIPFSVYDFFGYLSAGFLICAVVDFIFGGNWLLRESLPVSYGVFWTVTVYILGHINANLSSWFLENILVGRVIGRPNSILFQSPGERKILSRIFPGYFMPLPAKTQERILAKASQCGLKEPGEALFHHSRSAAKKDAATWGKMELFLERYGFCRNMSFALLGSAILLAASYFWQCRPLHGFLSGVCLFLSAGMFYRYLKFFRQYSYEMFTAYPDITEGE